MTIAMCYLTPEGVVLGADSTASINNDPGGFHYFNHNQKLFEIGQGSTLAALTWGLGSIGPISYRTLLADLSDDLAANPAGSVLEVATRWANRLWAAYSHHFAARLAEYQALAAKPQHDPTVQPPNAAARTAAEEEHLAGLHQDYYVGFCVAGYVLPDRSPQAFEVGCRISMAGPPVPTQVGATSLWGAPSIIFRLLLGVDGEARQAIIDSGKWAGTVPELDQILYMNRLSHPILPIRDAIDFVHTCIYSTIKALKFSSWSQICGGPIELAVITTDRSFRWVRHKEWDAGITEGERAT